jgi:hypothetical protein
VTRRFAVALVALAGCAAEAPAMESCASSLSGVWRDADGREWTALDSGGRVEIYPGFADVEGPPDVEVAPRYLELARAGELTGAVHRRYMRGGDVCDATLPARVVACRGQTLELELGAPPMVTAFAPCAFAPVPAPPRVTWTRVAPIK